MSTARIFPRNPARLVARYTQKALGVASVFGVASFSAMADVDTAPAGELDLAALCNYEAVAGIAKGLGTKVTVAALPREQMPGPFLPGGVKLTAARNGLPAFCQVTGSFVTNPDSGKTAGFLATFPANWNGKYLQVGCGGHCGNFSVNNPATPVIPVSVQGEPGDVLRKGYASFATDEGHVGFSAGKWAIGEDGKVNRDAVDDLLYRSQKVLSRMGKAFTEEFYARATGDKAGISHSYFAGCSGGGRDTLVAASYFPEEFDGFIAGSPYLDMVGTAFQGVGLSAATLRSAGADVPAELVALINSTVMAQCDSLDGMEDGLIQNPMACDFRPEKHLPRCTGDKPGQDCFTAKQIETVSTVLTAVTDEEGNVVQPGYAVSELQMGYRPEPFPEDLNLPEPWMDTDYPAAGSAMMGSLSNATLKVLANDNNPDFLTRSLLSFASGGDGPVTGFRVVVPAKEVANARASLRKGIGGIPENAAKFIEQDRKLLIWQNFSDQLLTPYMTVNYYKRLAQLHGGYDKLQRNARLFSMPGTAHCSGGLLVGPGSFDALDAMEKWVEQGVAPNALVATQYPATMFSSDFSKPPIRTMPLCKFPEMARYSGKGDVMDAANWNCPEGDEGMLRIGESGGQAGVIQ